MNNATKNKIHSFHVPSKPAGRGPFAVELLEPRSPDVVLNIGCFDGSLEYHFLLGKVSEFRGVDLNKDALSAANAWTKSILGRDDIFLNAAAEKLPFPDSYFDKVLCLDTFEHVADEAGTVDEIFRVLKPGGTLVLSVPNDFLNFLDPDNITRSARNIWRQYKKKPLLDHPDHRHYSEETLKKFFSKFEFEYIHKCGTPVFWTLAMLYTGIGLPASLVEPLAKITSPLENLEYRTALPTGFNIMIRARKPII